MPRRAISPIEERDSLKSRKSVVVEEAAGKRGVVTNQPLLEWSAGVLMEQRRDFSVEGVVEVGPRADYFVFLDREQLGEVFSPRLGAKPGSGEYTRLGRGG